MKRKRRNVATDAENTGKVFFCSEAAARETRFSFMKKKRANVTLRKKYPPVFAGGYFIMSKLFCRFLGGSILGGSFLRFFGGNFLFGKKCANRKADLLAFVVDLRYLRVNDLSL